MCIGICAVAAFPNRESARRRAFNPKHSTESAVAPPALQTIVGPIDTLDESF
jgi:hypothetical protein